VSRANERGVALLAAVSALSVLVVLATGLAWTTVVDQHLARHALAALEADALLRSGVAAAAVVLDERGDDDAPDAPTAPWLADSGRQPLGRGWVQVRLEDEARRLDLNAPELAAALPALLVVLGLDPALADAIADWTDRDDAPRPHGAEREAYASLAVPYLPRNAPLETVGELGLVRGIDAAALARLRPFVTVAGEHAVNVNTAPREVLLAVLGDPSAVERLLAARARTPLDPDALDAELAALPPPARARLGTRAQHYTAHAVARVGEVTRAADATLWAPGGAPALVVAWAPASAPPGD